MADWLLLRTAVSKTEPSLLTTQFTLHTQFSEILFACKLKAFYQGTWLESQNSKMLRVKIDTESSKPSSNDTNSMLEINAVYITHSQTCEHIHE